jgi:hypothetical protein
MGRGGLTMGVVTLISFGHISGHIYENPKNLMNKGLVTMVTMVRSVLLPESTGALFHQKQAGNRVTAVKVPLLSLPIKINMTNVTNVTKPVMTRVLAGHIEFFRCGQYDQQNGGSKP